jgi:hypothetical protein
MLKELGQKMIKTIITSLEAVDEDGMPDPKLRLAAFNSAHKFLVDFLPHLSDSDKKQLTQGMSEIVRQQLNKDVADSALIDELPDIASK